jgi:sugar transferase (PEP-CTERM/EpsH1 system associated)
MQMQLQRFPAQIPASRPPRSETSPARRLRILHVVSCLHLGGTEKGVLKIIDGLGNTEFEHQICAVRGVDEGFVRQMKVPAPVSAVGNAEPGFQFPFFRLVRAMNQFRPHIVHTRNFGALEAIPAARFARVPVAIHSEHGYELEILGGLPLRRRFVCGAFYALADQVFTVSRDLRDYHSKQSWLSPKKFSVIYNGVNTDRFSPRPELCGALRSEIGIPRNRFVIGTVSRLVPIKDHKTLLNAAEILVRQGKDVHVLIVGSGPELSKLQAYAAVSPEIAGRTLFLGASDRVPDLLNAMDVFVLPSISEGMSNTILEAMATGLPVVASRSGGNPELIEEGPVGCLFEPRDVEALAGHLSMIADDPSLCREYGHAARERAVGQFSLTDMVQRYRDLYMDLASRRGVWKGD